MMNSGERVMGQPGAPTSPAQAARPQRVYEVARELGVENKDFLSKVRTLGIDAKNHMSMLAAEDVARIRRAFDKERHDTLVEERVASNVIRRRSRAGAPPPVATRPAAAVPSPASAPAATPAAPDFSARARVEPLAAPAAPEEPEAEPMHAAPTSPLEEMPEREALAAPAPIEEEAHPLAAAPTHVPEPVEPEPAVTLTPEPFVAPSPASATPPMAAAPTVEETAAPSAPHATQPERRFIQLPGRPPVPGARDVTPQARPVPPPQPGQEPRRIQLPPRIQIEDRDAKRGQDLVMRRQQDARDRFKQQQRGGMPQKRKMQAGKKAKQTQITTPAAHKRIVKMAEMIAVSDLAHEMGVKATEVLKKLWQMGMVGVNINQSIDHDTAVLIAGEFGYEVESTAFREEAVLQEAEDRPEDLEGRAPVVTVMGHVDHGKTSLLDAIRSANVAAGEAGGITQHIGAYRVATPRGDITFLDTPGHEAFTSMRARGAQATDLVVLVVAADDGVMPQTVEAINHARDAEVPIVVAVNKIDKPGANPDLVKRQLGDKGLISEAWGGDTIFVEVSALKKTGIDQLLEMLALQSEVLELKANPKKPAKGIVIEAKLDRNRGPMATVLVQEGTLKTGDLIVTGEHSGKIRAMLDDKGRQVSEAGPSIPVEVLGLDGVPEAGETLNAVEDEKAAKTLVEHRRTARRQKDMGTGAKVSLENILEKIKEGEVKELKVVLKADVQGSAEALKDALARLSTEAVKVNVIQAAVGGITETDVNLAKAGGAIIIGFHVRPAGKASQLAEQERVEIKLYDIIYEALDDVKKAMAGMLAPVLKEKALGRAAVRQIFNIPKIGTVAGCAVTDGVIRRSAQARLIRDSVKIHEGRLGSLKRFKDDVREVQQGYECGLSIEGYNDVKVGDVIESFEIEQVAATL
jgi:translation initiation factor IF-2